MGEATLAMVLWVASHLPSLMMASCSSMCSRAAARMGSRLGRTQCARMQGRRMLAGQEEEVRRPCLQGVPMAKCYGGILPPLSCSVPLVFQMQEGCCAHAHSRKKGHVRAHAKRHVAACFPCGAPGHPWWPSP